MNNFQNVCNVLTMAEKKYTLVEKGLWRETKRKRGLHEMRKPQIASILFSFGDTRTKTMKKVLALVFVFVFILGTAVCHAESSPVVKEAGLGQTYTVKMKRIAFEIPDGWKQQGSTQDYDGMQAIFNSPENDGTIIQYACLDLVVAQNLPESMRSYLNTESYTEENIRAYYESVVTDLTVEKTKIGDLDCFLMHGIYGVPSIFVYFIEEGYYHQLGIFEADINKLEEHEKLLFNIIKSVKFSGTASTDANVSTAAENEFGIVGATVLFGRYDQDNDQSNGPEKIEWIVLDVRDGKSLLLSKYALDTKAYHWTLMDITWADCSLREWLNTEFAASAFNQQEKERILTTHVPNDSSQSLHGIDGGKDTEDQVFLLSSHEVFDLYLTEETARLCAPTDTAIRHGAAASDICYSYGRGTWSWWLRSPGDGQDTVAVIRYNGSYAGDINDLTYLSVSRATVRPAVWVKTDAGQKDTAADRNETSGAPAKTSEKIRNEKLDASFEANTLKLLPSEVMPVQFDPSALDLSDELKIFLNSEGITEADLGAKMGSLQDSDIKLLSVSPTGNSGILDVQGTKIAFFDGQFHMIYPSSDRSVQDTYSKLNDYYRKFLSGSSRSPIGREGVVYSPSGRNAAVFNIQSTSRGILYFDPVIIDLTTGQLVLTATYPSSLKEDEFGYVTAAAFSDDSRYFYYTLRGGNGSARIRLFCYDLFTGETEECFRSEFDVYPLPRMYQIADRNLIVMEEALSNKNPDGLMNFIWRDGEWTINTHKISLPKGYFHPSSLHYSDNSGYAVLVGELFGLIQGTYAFQVISPENGFDGFDRYLYFNLDTDEVISVSAEEYMAVTDQYTADTTVRPYRLITNTVLSPDGNYLLVNTNGHEWALFLIRLEDLSIRKVEVPDAQQFLRSIGFGSDMNPGIEWNTDELIISTYKESFVYRIE